MANFDLDSYVTTQERIVRFWEEYPNGAIRTNLMSDPGDFTICRYVAKVYKEHTDPEPAATGWAFEIAGKGMTNQTSHEENCETSAIGRALANLGYATKGENRPSREEMSKVERGNGGVGRRVASARSDAAPSIYPPRNEAEPTAITAKTDKTMSPMQKLHGLAQLRGLEGEGKRVHEPLRCVCQFILPKVRSGEGYVPLTSMTQLTDQHLAYLYTQIEAADEHALMLMAVDYPAAIKGATTLEELERIRMDLTSIGAKDHTHPELLKAFKTRKEALSPKRADVAA